MNLPHDHLVDAGVTVYNRTLVEGVEFVPGLLASIQPSIALLDERTSSKSPHTDIQRKGARFAMPEMFLQPGAEPLATTLLLGKAVTAEYGSDFVVVDTTVSSVSEEATAKAQRMIGHHCHPDFSLFAFLLERRETDKALVRNPRIEALRTQIEGISIASMCIVELVEPKVDTHGSSSEASPPADGDVAS